MAPEGCSATRCRRARAVAVVATLTAALNTFGSSARRSGLAGVLLASTASLAAAGPAKASVAPFSGDFSRTERKLTGYVMTDSTIITAVAAWLSDATAAEATYGHISTWATGGVTNMAWLFCDGTTGTSPGCPGNPASASFNEDIGAWDTSGVTDMHGMFISASAFNQDIGDWAVHSVKDMESMFYGAAAFNQDISAWDTSGVTTMYMMFISASAFDQDLGWCVDDGVFDPWTPPQGYTIQDAFSGTQCASTSCGVVQGTCAPTPAPPVVDAARRLSAGAALLALTLI
jgi:surface protein